MLKTDRFGPEQTDSPATMEQVYVLKLEGDRYYVGKSSDVAKRVKEHATGKGAGYTKLYKPTQVVEVRPMKSEQDENNLTREYMTKYGVNNVRGGSYTQIALAPEVKQVLELEIRGNTDACFACGKTGHFANRCPSKVEEDTVWCCEYCNREFATESVAAMHEQGCKFRKLAAMAGRQKLVERKTAWGGGGGGVCYRCGRAGHYSPDCYAGTHRKGYDLDD